MKTYLAAIVAVLPLAFAAGAQAQSVPYTYTAEIGYARNNVDNAFHSGVSPDFDTVKLRGGAQYKQFGLEMEIAAGVGNATGAGYKAYENYEAGIYGVYFFPVAKGVDIFGRVGFEGAQFHEKILGVNVSSGETGYGVGGGVRWFPGDGKNGVRVEYTRYGFQDADVNNFGATYVHKF